MKKEIKWKVIRTIWPYKDGYGVVSVDRMVVIDSGLSKEEAQSVCNRMNREGV